MNNDLIVIIRINLSTADGHRNGLIIVSYTNIYVLMVIYEWYTSAVALQKFTKSLSLQYPVNNGDTNCGRRGMELLYFVALYFNIQVSINAQ